MRRRLALVSPVVLVATMYVVFHAFTNAFGVPLGYLLAFAVYWVGWCGLLPVAVLGRRGVRDLFAASDTGFTQLGIKTHALLWWPIPFALVFAFLPRVATAGTPVILGSLVLGAITGLTEEVFWRGVYIRLFPHDVWINTVYPSIAFAMWHLCPLSILPSRYSGGAASFLVYSVLLGLSYATAARRTQSIRWCTVSHCLHDTLGLGAFLYVGWLR